MTFKVMDGSLCRSNGHDTDEDALEAAIESIQSDSLDCTNGYTVIDESTGDQTHTISLVVFVDGQPNQ